MAVTKIWKVKDRFDKLIDYAMNPEKTASSIDKVIDYATDGERPRTAAMSPESTATPTARRSSSE